MKKLLLASVFAIASFPAYAADNVPSLQQCRQMLEDQAPETSEEMACVKRYGEDAIYKSKTVCAGKYEQKVDFDRCMQDWVDQQPAPPARVTVTPQYQGPPPIGWVYGPYTMCGDPPRCSTGVVNVPADGLNVRTVPMGLQ
jgi:hypothetical protein